MRWETTELYLRMLLAQKIGIPVLGKMFFVYKTGSSTDNFEEWINNDLDIPSELLFEGNGGVAEAYANATAYRNDVVLVFPGAYDVDTQVTWAKPRTHMIGLGGPNQLGDYSEPNVVIYTDTAGTANTLDVAAENCIFMDLNIQNAGANAGNLSAVKLEDYGCWFKNVRIAGCMASTQAATALACSLWIRGAGMYPIFEDCVIGHDVWTTRSGANQGVILFNQSNAQCNGGQFKNCQILSVCETATGNFVAVVGNNVLGRGWVFDNCIFNNYTTGTRMNQAFYQSASNSIYDRSIILKDCVLNPKGCDAWQDSDYGNIYGNQAASAAAGGKAVEISE